jgi:hypothetical protein
MMSGAFFFHAGAGSLLPSAARSSSVLRKAEFVERKQQQSPTGNLHLYFHTDPNYPAKTNCHERGFEQFRIESSMGDIFGLPEISN